jgi:hypothetical protein
MPSRPVLAHVRRRESAHGSHVQAVIGPRPPQLGFCEPRCAVFVLVNSQRTPRVHKYKNGVLLGGKPQLGGPGADEVLYL